MATDYPHVEEHDGTYYVHGSRVPILSLVTVWRNGSSPETTRQKFATLTLAEVYAAITFYLDHQAMLDAHFAQMRAEEEATLHDIAAANADFRTEMQRRFDALIARDQASAS